MKTTLALFLACLITGCETLHKKNPSAGAAGAVPTPAFSWEWYSNKWEEIKATERGLLALQQNTEPPSKDDRAKARHLEQTLAVRQNLMNLAAQYNDMRQAEIVRAFTARGLPSQINITLTLTGSFAIPEKGAGPPAKPNLKNPSSL